MNREKVMILDQAGKERKLGHNLFALNSVLRFVSWIPLIREKNKLEKTEFLRSIPLTLISRLLVLTNVP